jgi:hypothetical protein
MYFEDLKKFSSFFIFGKVFGHFKNGHLFLSIFRSAKDFWIFEKPKNDEKPLVTRMLSFSFLEKQIVTNYFF